MSLVVISKCLHKINFYPLNDTKISKYIDKKEAPITKTYLLSEHMSHMLSMMMLFPSPYSHKLFRFCHYFLNFGVAQGKR